MSNTKEITRSNFTLDDLDSLIIVIANSKLVFVNITVNKGNSNMCYSYLNEGKSEIDKDKKCDLMDKLYELKKNVTNCAISSFELFCDTSKFIINSAIIPNASIDDTDFIVHELNDILNVLNNNDLLSIKQTNFSYRKKGKPVTVKGIDAVKNLLSIYSKGVN